MDPAQMKAAAAEADAALASRTTDHVLQAAIAQNRPDLWAALAANPETYPDLLTWLSATEEPDVLSALEARADTSVDTGDSAVEPVDGTGADTGTGDSAVEPVDGTGADTGEPVGGASAGTAVEPGVDPSGAPSVPQPAAGNPASSMAAGVAAMDAAARAAADTATAVTAATSATAAAAPGMVQTVAGTVPAIGAAQAMGAAQVIGAGRKAPTLGRLVAALMALVLVLGGLGTWYVREVKPNGGFFGGSGTTAASGDGTTPDSAGPGTEYVTPCGSAPEFEVLLVEDADGALDVKVEATATCPEGDVLDGAVNSIVLYGTSSTTGGGPSDAVIASGDFDFSSAPLVIPSGGAVVTLRFSEGHFFRTADDVDVSTVLVECVPDRSGGSGSVSASTGGMADGSGSATSSTTSTDPAAEEDAAGDALRWQADHDEPTILSTLTGKWTPQLSSKKPGLVADGIVWDNRSTLGEFLQLRQKYPSAMLMYSNDWSIFDPGGSWWVTISGIPFDTAAEANAWCDAEGYDADHCFAKLIDPSGSWEGTTVMRK